MKSYGKSNQSFFRIVIILTFTLFLSPIARSQNVKDLEKQRKQTLERLETTKKMLNETKKSQRSSITKLNIIGKNIKDRKTLITNISNEIGQLDLKMTQLNREKQQLESRLEVLKKDYARLVQQAYINRNLYTKIMFILSAKTFDQSYRRMRYLQEYTEYRRDQVRQIEQVKSEIVRKNDSLDSNKKTKVEVVNQKQSEAEKLKKDQQRENVVLSDLKKKESRLRADQKIQQRKADNLNRRIEQLIAEQIRRDEERRQAAANKKNAIAKNAKPTSRNTTRSSRNDAGISTLTKEETLIAGSFERNKGRLPWPTSNGFISGHFGIQQHPVLIHVTTNNKGIYIQTPAGSSARAIFEGVVTQCFSVPGSNNAVIIQHGSFRTVYANLTQLYVKEGQKVTAKEPIGKIYTDDEKDNKTELYFQIWNGRTLLNPESWIAR